jgi:RHS repeat-associated protein
MFMRITGLFKYDAWGNLESCGEYDESVVDGDYSNSSSRWVPVNDSYDEYGNSKHCYFMSGAGIDGGIGLILSGSNSSCSDVWWGNKTLFASPDTDYILSGYYCFTEMSNTKDIAKVQLLYYDSTGNLIATHESTMNYYSSDWEPFWKPFTLGGNPSGSSDSFSSVVFYDQIRLKIVGLSSDEGEYTGKKEDAGTGLKYFNARWYDSETGRFVEEDPIQSEWLGYFNEKSRGRTERVLKLALDKKGQESVTEKDIGIEAPRKHNLDEIDGGNWYWYCGNNPVNRIDPDGKWFGFDDVVTGPVDELLVAGGLAVGAAFGSKWAADTLDAALDKANEAVDTVKGVGKAIGKAVSRCNPFKGKPGSTSRSYDRHGKPKQDRTYGKDGYPDTDTDYDHDHGQGKPHTHKWERPSDGSAPTAENRGSGK